MILTTQSQNLVDFINSMDISQYPESNQIIALKEKSIPLLSKIIKNMQIEFIRSIKINHKFNGSMVIELMKYANDFRFKNFINSVNSKSLSKEEMYDFINYNNNEIHEIIPDIDELPKKFGNILKYYPKNLLSRFVPPSIQDDIINRLRLLNVYKVVYKTNILNFYFYTEDKIDYNKMIVLFLKAFFLLETFGIENKSIPIYLFFSNVKKRINYSQNYLGPREINSGVSSVPYFDHLSSEICIFREEEIEKLLLHELVHATKIDRDMRLTKSLDKQIKCNFNISKSIKINIFEAFTESVAFILNIVFNSILSYKDIVEILNNEFKFSIYQCAKIIKFYGYESVDQLFCENCCFDGDASWNEKTSVFSYFLLKTCIIYGSDLFIKDLLDNTLNVKKLLKRIKSNFKKIKNLLGEFINKDLSKNDTLRMTLYDFEWSF